MRTLQISTDTYAGIWAARKPGEDTEDEILRRLLGIAPTRQVANRPEKIGFSDPRFGIELPEGFEIFRVYKGTMFRARAYDGKWQLENNGKSYPSLNQLSRAVSGNVENAWQNWYFRDDNNKRVLVSALRENPAFQKRADV